MTSISAGHIILTPTQPVGSGRPQRGSNPGPPDQESRALPTELPRLEIVPMDAKMITEKIKTFYTNLFKLKENINTDSEFNTLLRDLPKGADEEATKLNGNLIVQEVSTALENIKNNRWTGTDGFNVEFTNSSTQTWEYLC